MNNETAPGAPRAMYAGILLCSVGVLMLEILLTRVFSFTIWYHLAYLTISTALLGFGAAGSLLAVFPSLWQRDPRGVAARCSVGAGVSMLLAMAILGRNPLDPQQILTEPWILFLKLLGYYIAVLIPFLLAGMAVSIPLAAYPLQVNRLYGSDLFGAGLGCLAAVASLTWLDAAGALTVCGAVFAAAGFCYAHAGATRTLSAILAIALLAGAMYAGRALEFLPSPSKVLALALSEPGTELLFTRWSPVNRVDFHTNSAPKSTFWAYYGRSPKYKGPMPSGYSIEYDGHNGTNVYEVKNEDSMQMLDEHILRIPYLIEEQPEVLVIGVGGGVDVLNALRRGAKKVVGVELQPITLELHRGMFAPIMGEQMQRPEVELHAGEGRHFIRSSDRKYDVIQITAVDTFSAQSSGAYVLAESYLYTVEAITDYLDHLKPDGVLSIVLGDLIYKDEKIASPLSSRLMLAAREALKRRGAADPAAHIMNATHRAMLPGIDSQKMQAIGSFTQTLLVKPTPFTEEQTSRIAEFVDQYEFEMRVVPGSVEKSTSPEVARLLHLSDDELEDALAAEEFELEPVTDDKPFFYHVQRWRNLLFARGETLWMFPGSTVGQYMLLMMFAQSIVVGGVLVFLPLYWGPRKQLPRGKTTGFLVYFLALGLGFLLIEISFVQKYILILGYPTYSLSVTIFSLLIFAALGAWISRIGFNMPRRFLGGLLVLTVMFIVLEVFGLPLVRESLLSRTLAERVAVTVLLQFPLGTCLGMYFPTGIELLRRTEPLLIPWAWAVNGVASVVSSVLAVILGMAIGFSGVAIVAAGIYIVGTTALLLATREAKGLKV